MTTVSVPPRFDDVEFLRLDRWLDGCSDDRVVVAAGSNEWSTAGAVAGLRCLVDSLSRVGAHIEVEMPRAPVAAGRLLASGFCSGLACGAGGTTAASSGWAGVSLRQIVDARDAERFSNDVFLALRPTDHRAAVMFATAAGELTSNSVTHSGAGNGALAIAEWGMGGHELAVVDRGIGFRGSLVALAQTVTDTDAVAAALGLGVPRFGRGLGLPDLARHVAGTPGSELILRSGYCGIRLCPGEAAALEELDHPLRGTFATYRLPR